LLFIRYVVVVVVVVTLITLRCRIWIYVAFVTLPFTFGCLRFDLLVVYVVTFALLLICVVAFTTFVWLHVYVYVCLFTFVTRLRLLLDLRLFDLRLICVYVVTFTFTHVGLRLVVWLPVPRSRLVTHFGWLLRSPRVGYRYVWLFTRWVTLPFTLRTRVWFGYVYVVYVVTFGYVGFTTFCRYGCVWLRYVTFTLRFVYVVPHVCC